MKWNTIVTISLAVLAALAWMGALLDMFFGGLWRVETTLYMMFPIVLTGCACLGWVLVTMSKWHAVGDPRCRRCGYVLKGLPEPRCPECGEPI